MQPMAHLWLGPVFLADNLNTSKIQYFTCFNAICERKNMKLLNIVPHLPPSLVFMSSVKSNVPSIENACELHCCTVCVLYVRVSRSKVMS